MFIGIKGATSNNFSNVRFQRATLEQVIDKTLLMDKTQNGHNMSMMALLKSLPTIEELRFRQAMQCMTYLNPGYSTVKCTLKTQCPICHSKAHTIDQCDYNMLNKAATSVRRIEPEDDTLEDQTRSQYREEDTSRYDECYWSDRNQRDDYRR